MATAADALHTLPRSQLLQIRSTVASSQASIADLKSAKQRLIKSIDIQLSPLLTYRSQAEAALASASAGVNSIPAELVLLSPDLAGLNPGIQRSLVGKSEASLNILFDINHLTAERKQMIADIAQLDALDAYFTTITQSINDALSRP